MNAGRAKTLAPGANGLNVDNARRSAKHAGVKHSVAESQEPSSRIMRKL
jgi:hypothetical protein